MFSEKPKGIYSPQAPGQSRPGRAPDMSEAEDYRETLNHTSLGQLGPSTLFGCPEQGPNRPLWHVCALAQVIKYKEGFTIC